MYRDGKERVKKGMWSTRRIKCFLLVLIGLFLLTACGEKEDEIPMGRYNEREVQVGGDGFSYMHPLPDGGYYLYGNNVSLTKVEADGSRNKINWSWENNSNIHVKNSFGIADDGSVIFGYMPKFYTEEEYDEYADDGDLRYFYCYVDASGEHVFLDLHGTDWSIRENLEYFAFAPDNRIYAASNVRVYRVDVESGEVESLFDTGSAVNEFAFIGDVMIALDRNKAYLYDMTEEKLLEDNEVLSKFVASHQTGNKAIVLAAAKETAPADDNVTETSETVSEDILYIGCRTGLYRYVWNGSVIEQIADGQMLSLGNSQYAPSSLQALPDDEFRLYLSGNHMVELFYDETIPSRPSTELKIYSLNENGRIRYAGQLFQKEHPDVLVKYETGMDGDTAVSKEDALRNLSTEILAGEGPDILILDGMDIEQYADKDVLRSLDGFIASYEEEGSLYQGIVDGMRMGDENTLYAIPLNVYLPMYQTDRKYLGGEASLADIVAGMEQARADYPEGPLIFTPTQGILLRQLSIVCEPAWTKEDGSLDQEKITEYYEAASRLWELDCAGMTEEERQKWQQDCADNTGNGDGVLTIVESLSISDGQFRDVYGIGQTKTVLGCLRSPNDTEDIHVVLANFNDGIDFRIKHVEELYFDKLTGQAENVFYALSIVGICEDAKEPELAEEFLALCLSSDIQNKWWLGPGRRSEGGIPIRKESFAACMDYTNREFAEVAGWTAAQADQMFREYFYPTEEEQEWFHGLMEEAEVPYFPGLPLGDTVEEVGLIVLDGGMTPQEGAKEVARRMAIAMEE